MLEGELGVADFVNLDDENNDSLKRPVRIVLADILVRDVVKELECRVVANLYRSATDLKLFVRIMEIDNRDCDAGIASQVSDLEAALLGTNQDAVAPGPRTSCSMSVWVQLVTWRSTGWA